ncbi:DNA recombination protein RmuC [bacterium]|nr:DNA recombination protein RmuC [bacterium]
MDLVNGILLGSVVSVLLYFLLKRFDKGSVSNEIKQELPDLLKNTVEHLVTISNEKLISEKKEIRADMESKRGEIERLVKMIREELNKAETERLGTFSKLVQQLDDHKMLTEKLSVSTENLKKVLSNNQLRGQFGEQVADNLLKMAGFVVGKDYEFNKEQSESATRPDFTIYLPDGTKVNVDAKFPYANLQKSAETDDEEGKRNYLKLFEQDVKQKIKQVISRDYINPEDKTVDFVLLFIPNEMIFSFIYEKLQPVWQDALEKKVVFVGPFSFTALLRMIKQSYENFRVQQNIQSIVTHVRALEKEFGKFNDEFVKVGDRIDSLSKQYNDVSKTRFTAISKVMDKVRLEDSKAEETSKLLD